MAAVREEELGQKVYCFELITQILARNFKIRVTLEEEVEQNVRSSYR